MENRKNQQSTNEQKRAGVLYGSIQEVRCLYAYSNYLFSGGFDRRIRVWDLKKCQIVRILDADGYIFSLRVENNILYSAGAKIIAWDYNSGKQSLVFENIIEPFCFSMAISNGMIYTGGNSNFIVCYKINNPKNTDIIKTPSAVWSLSIYGEELYAGLSSGEIRAFSLKCLKCTKIFNCKSGAWGIAFYCNKMFTGSEDGIIRIWELKNKKKIVKQKKPIESLNVHNSSIVSMNLKDDILFSGGEDMTVSVINARTLKYIKSFKSSDKIWSVFPYKNYLYTGSVDSTISLWNIKDLLLRYSILQDLHLLLHRQECYDTIIKTKDGQIKIVSLLVEKRTKKPIKELINHFEAKTTKESMNFFELVYTGRSNFPTENQNIFSELKIDEKILKGRKKVIEVLENFYQDEKSKDFTIIFPDETTIQVHKLILIARSNLFRGMFLSVVDNSNQVHDYSEIPSKTMKSLIDFLYLDSCSSFENSEIEYFQRAKDYFLLRYSSLKY
eukprot:Anaeramoba_ignava/a94713_8.p1 GENE.a94713_8~~a94713_8.p1  ORF type:complete len:499 (-),score=127.25 a94713_8:80-1576(-)